MTVRPQVVVLGPRERAGFYTVLEMPRDVGELHRVPELRFARDAEVHL